MSSSVNKTERNNMLNNATLLALYKQEKADMDMPSDPFPSFKDWKAEYAIDWEKNHTMTDAEKALEEADRIVAEAEKELRQHKTTYTKPKKKKATTKKTIVKPTVTKPKAPNKKQRATKVYQSLMVNGEHPSRQDAIAAFVDQIGMTQAGASTYVYNIKKELSK